MLYILSSIVYCHAVFMRNQSYEKSVTFTGSSVCKSNSCLHEDFARRLVLKQKSNLGSAFLCCFPLLSVFFFLTAFSLECYACTSQAELSGGSKCESDKAEKITCPPLYNRCMAIKYTMSLGQLGATSVEFRNCSINTACDPNSQFNSKCKTIYLFAQLEKFSLQF